jgi:hypothetical protein
MPGVVITSGALTCSDSGKATMTSTAKLTVSRTPVVLETDLSTFTPYVGCTFTPPGGSNKPCAQTNVTSGGTAQKLTVGGKPVLLDDLQATTDNASSVTLTAGENKLTAK